jgi:predicted RecA/RadA family phage recombinase
MAWIETTKAGDIVKEQGMRIETITAAEDIKKGQVVTLATGEVADITAAETGPFGVAIADIDNGEEGEVAVAPTVIYVLPGAAGCTAFTHLMPSEAADEQGRVVDVSTPTFDEVVCVSLEGAADGSAAIKAQLGYM